MSAEPITKKTAKDGTVSYWCRIDVGLDPATGKRRQRRSSHKTMREARAWLAERRVEAARGTYVERTDTTVGEYLDQWLAGRQNLRPSTRSGYRLALAPYVEQLGGVPVRNLNRRHLEDVRDRLLSGELRKVGIRNGSARVGGKPMSPRSVCMGLGLVQQALDMAVRDDIVVKNVATYVERPTGDAKAGAAWSAEQVEAFRAVALDDRLAGAWALSLLGLRRGEVCGLRWDRVDLDAGLVHVDSTRVYVAGEEISSKPKTRRGVRTVPLPAWALEALRYTRSRQAHERAAAGLPGHVGEYVAENEVGAPVRLEWYSDAFARLAREAGVPVIRLHDARHTSVTLMRAKGVPDATTAAWHGHSEAVMRSTYTHVGVDAMRAAAAAL
ncbi:tyrosine-type recombinase/integrase [Streptomyces sp. NP160]|uniref:tyrosine-type recombinase/integrase n=1 Tax=Streptomyces sp. NP160 TaxID=2586637 RepID=UPI0015D6565C|nr:tyrosine-type recombinase/integrase [Streptomyces sp. NP160]